MTYLEQLPKALEGLTVEDLRAGLSSAQFKKLSRLVELAQHTSSDDLCSRAVASFDEGPLAWLTRFTATENPHYEAQGREFKAPFPKKPYFVPLFDAFLKEPVTRPRLFIAKSREMMTSWCVTAYATWRAQWFKWDCVLQTGSMGKVTELVDYAAQLWRNQPQWLKDRHPLERREPTSQELTFAAGGRVMAIPSGADKIRLYHPTLYVMDEAAFLPEAEECFNTAQPVAVQIIAVSTAAPGWYSTACER